MKQRIQNPWTIGLLTLLLLSLPLLAQQKVTFAYDAAGNRISRTITLGAQKAPAQPDDAVAEPEVYNDRVGERTVKIYPNPTKGQLQVEIVGSDSDTQSQLMLYNSQGVLLQNISTAPGKTDIQMTDYASGWYILRIKDGEKVIEYKIIKE